MDTEKFKQQLLEMQSDLMEVIRGEMSEEIPAFDVDGDVADRADVLTNAAIVESLTYSQRASLEHIRMALERIQDGRYGVCRVCGAPIEEDRLDAMPTAETCKQHMS